MKPTIILTMMVKNEANVIRRCLDSVKRHIDHWVIADNGSTDNTEVIIKECLRDIPGEFHHVEWRGMGENRTEVHDFAAAYCEKHGIENAYHMVIDADESLEWNGKIPKSDNKVACYWGSIKDFSSGDAQPRSFLIENDRRWIWDGKVHHKLHAEGWPMPDQENDIHVGATVYHHADGHSWQDIIMKYKRRAAIIEGEIAEWDGSEESREWAAGRYFSLAKCYQMLLSRDDPRLLETARQRAINAFQWVAELSDVEQEVYHCLQEIAKLTDDLALMLDAYDFRPQRPDALYELAKGYEAQDKIFIANVFYLAVSETLRNHPKCGDTVFHNVTIRDRIKEDRQRIKKKMHEWWKEKRKNDAINQQSEQKQSSGDSVEVTGDRAEDQESEGRDIQAGRKDAPHPAPASLDLNETDRGHAEPKHHISGLSLKIERT